MLTSSVVGASLTAVIDIKTLDSEAPLSELIPSEVPSFTAQKIISAFAPLRLAGGV